MSNLLEQSEVDALLAAVETTGTSWDKSAIETVVSPQQHDKQAGVYDFRRPQRVSKDQIRALQAIHEVFARNLAESLSGFLRQSVEVRLVDIQQLTYGEFANSLPNPTCLNILSAKPLEGMMCLEISPLIMFPIIDRLLGGGSLEALIPQRPLTGIELRLARKITDRALQQLAHAWSSLMPVQFELIDVESNAQLAQVVTANETSVTISFTLQLGNKTGTMSLCLPVTSIESLLDKLVTQDWLLGKAREDHQMASEALVENIKGATVNLRVFLAQTTITLGQLMDLAVGDVIQTEKLATQDLAVQVEGKNKFAGQMAQLHGKRAVKITRLAQSNEPL